MNKYSYRLTASWWHRRFGKRRLRSVAKTPSVPVFSSFKEIALGLGIYTYFLGWIYAYYYFSSFEITLASLDIPVYYFVVYSFSAIYCVKGLAIASAIFLVLPFVHKRQYVLYALFVLLIPFLYHLGKTQGLEAADAMRNNGDNDRIELALEPNFQASLNNDLLENNKNHRLRFLEETKDRLILFYQPPAVDGTRLPVVIYDLKRDRIAGIRKIVE